jgi:hypothetical protein
MMLDEILNLIEGALIAAPRSFENVANGTSEEVLVGAERMPESWAVASVMNAVRAHGLAAVPEVRVNADLDVFESGGRILSPESVPTLLKNHAKVDLFIGEPSRSGSRIKLRVALEIKGPLSNWRDFPKDFDRVRELGNILREKGQAAVFAYVTAPLCETERESEAEKLAKKGNLPRTAFRVKSVPAPASSQGPARHVSVYMYVTRSGGQDVA